MWSARRVAMLVLALAILVQAGQFGDLAPFVIGGVLVLAQVGVVWFLHTGRGRSTEPAQRYVGALTTCWLVLAILPTHSFTNQTSSDATTSAGIQPILEFAVFSVAFVVALGIIRSLEPTFDRARPPGLLCLFPIWATASMFWSVNPLYSMIRGWQMGVVATLAWATVALGRSRPALLDDLAPMFLRWFVRIALTLTALGFAFGRMYVSVAPSNRSRFTWIGAHPNGSGLVLSAAIVILAATPAGVLRLPGLARWGAVGVLTYAMYENHSRAAWLCLAVGLLSTFVFKGRLLPFLRWSGTPFLAACGVAALYFRGDEIWDYLRRDQSSSQLATGSGRKELWSIGLNSLDTAFDWICGHGYGITRILFQEGVKWEAGEAHNSVLAILVSLGAIGLLTIGAVWVQAVRHLLKGQLWRTSPYGIALLSSIALVFVNGMAGDVWAEPTIGFVILYLVAAIAMVDRSPLVPLEPGLPRSEVARS